MELSGKPRHLFIHLIENDTELFWKLTPNIQLPQHSTPFFGLISNSQVLREDHEIDSTKDTGEVRILFIGDSCIFGYLLASRDTVVQQVENQLSDHFPEVKVECINAGVPGYSIYQGWRWLQSHGSNLKPDLIVVNFGWNDGVMWDGYSDMDVYNTFQMTLPPYALRWRSLAKLVYRAMNLPTSPESLDKTRPRLLPGEFSDLLNLVRKTSMKI